MDPQHIPTAIAALVKKGILAPDAILNTLSQRIKDFGILRGEELPHLRKTFNYLCTNDNGTEVITQSTFISFLQTAGVLPPSVAQAGALIYNSLLYLSQAPFYDSLPLPTHLTFDGLLRALVWTDSERSRPVYEESIATRTRAPADTRRLIFQSLATTHDGKKLPFDAEFARMQAERMAFDFASVLDGDSWKVYAKTNYDEDGDEIFHDLLDVLYVVSQPPQVGWGGVPRDGFREFAKEFYGEQLERLHDLSIPQDEFQALVKVFLVTQFGKPIAQIEQDADLDRVADCVVRAFAQVPGMGITWEMFDQTISKTVCLARSPV